MTYAFNAYARIHAALFALTSLLCRLLSLLRTVELRSENHGGVAPPTLLRSFLIVYVFDLLFGLPGPSRLRRRISANPAKELTEQVERPVPQHSKLNKEREQLSEPTS